MTKCSYFYDPFNNYLLQERKWAKLPHITNTLDSSNGTSLIRLTGSYAVSRMGRGVATTFAVLILALDFGQDDESEGKSGIDYLLMTSVYFLISELNFGESGDHLLVR